MNGAIDDKTPLQRGTWLRIVHYCNFHDIPRRMLLIDHDFLLWLFDCPFESDTDDFADRFDIYRTGHDTGVAKSMLESTCIPATPVERIPVAHVEFDETCRYQVFVHTESTAHTRFDRTP